MTIMRKAAKWAAAAVLVLAIASTPLYAEDDAPVLSVGSESMTQQEIIELLRNTAGGNAMMVGLMLTQSTLAEREEMVKQMADAILFAEGAKMEGLAERSDIAFKLKWQRIQLLMEAYLQDASTKWDMSEKAMKEYYSSHKEEFVQAEAAHIRHILTSAKEDATNAILDIYRDKDFAKTAQKFSRDPNTAARGGDLGWMEKGTMPAQLEAEINKAQLKSLIGPVKSDLGWHVMEVLERRPQKQLSFDEAVKEVEQRLQMSYIEKELSALREKLKVKIDSSALENLAGIPAAKPEPTENDAPAVTSGDKVPAAQPAKTTAPVSEDKTPSAAKEAAK